MSLNIRKIKETVALARPVALVAAANKVLKQAVENAPKLTGDLRDSAGVTEQDGVAYVFFNTPYAVRQHEDMTYRHTVGGPKYLERALRETDVLEELARELKRVLQ